MHNSSSGISAPANRRQFLATSMAAAAAPALAWPQTALAKDLAPLDFYKVVYDRSHPASAAFGRAAAQMGLPAHGIDGDVTALWYDDLYHRWKKGPAAIAGLTRPGAAMALEMMGWDAGLRTLLRGKHDGAVHTFEGTDAALALAKMLDGAAEWNIAAAQVMNLCPAARSAKSQITLSCAASSAASSDPLVSWVLAPRA